MRDELQWRAEAGRPALGVGKCVVRSVGRHRILAPQGRPDDVDVLAGSRQRLPVRDAVPALHDLGPRDAQAQQEAPATQVIERHGRHGRHRRSAGRHLHDAGSQAYRRGVGRKPGQRCCCVGAVGLGRPDRVVPEPVGLDHRSRISLDTGAAICSPIPHEQPELHATSSAARYRSTRHRVSTLLEHGACRASSAPWHAGHR